MKAVLTAVFIATFFVGVAHSREENRPDSLPLVPLKALPAEAAQTLQLLRRGGPFPYQKDGSAFGNREKILPPRERGWYREYTVKTTGAKDRGGRRIVAGRDGTLYYTDDHYRSFMRVLE